MSVPSPPALSVPDTALVRLLYEEGRYLDAHTLTRDLWIQPAARAMLELPALVLGFRLARQLGSDKIAGALARRAHAIDPDDPEVRYYCPLVGRRPLRLLEALERFEASPELGSGDPELDASWCASHATIAAVFRDFERARERVERARAIGGDDGWTDACAAHVELAAHEWTEGLRLAERAFAQRPWNGAVASALAEALEAEGRFAEAADRLIASAERHGQSFVPLYVGLMSGVRACRRGRVGDPRGWAEARRPVADRLDRYAPLADRSQRRAFEALRAQLALLAEDRAAARAHARAVRSPWYDRLAAHLEEDDRRPRVMLEHRMLRQRHDTCLPASAAVALSALGREVDHEAVVRAITSLGTPLHRLADWGRAEGLDVRYFRGTLAVATALLERGLAFVLTSAETDSAHAWAAIGLDPARGILFLHDPARNGLAELDLEGLAPSQAPWGPRCMLLLPPERAKELEDLELPDEAASEALAEIHRRLDDDGPSAALAELEAQAATLGPEWHALERAFLLERAGRPVEARARLLEGFEANPTSVYVRRGLVDTTLAAAPFEEARRTLRAIAEARGLPRGETTAAWEDPEPAVEIALAHLLMQSAEHFDEARRVLERVLARAPLASTALSALGQLRLRSGDEAGARLALRLAATMEPERLDHARAYADLLVASGDEDAAVAFLRARAEGRDRSTGADLPWRVLVELLESVGRPDDALEALEAARDRWPEDGRLAAFAAERDLLGGRRARAEDALEAARSRAPRSEALRIEVLRAHLDGELEVAEAGLRELVEAEPADIDLRRRLLGIVRDLRGPEAAEAVLEAWWQSRPDGDEAIEALHIEHLTEEGRIEEALALLEARNARQPNDTWALLERARLGYERALRRGEGVEEVRALARRALEVHPGLSSAEALLGRLAERAGDLAEAREHYARAVIESPLYLYALTRLGVITARLGPDAWPATRAALDRAFGGPGRRLHGAGDAVVMLARHLGGDAARAALARWADGKADDPEVQVALAELELAERPGVQAAEAVLARTASAARRHPLHVGLGIIRARAFALAARFEEAARAYGALARANPGQAALRNLHFQALEQSGDVEAALDARARWIAAAPRDLEAVVGQVDLLERLGRVEKARAVLEAATERAPSEPLPWHRRAELLFRLGDREALLDLARELETRHPEAGWAAFERARILGSDAVAAPVADVIACFERASALDRDEWSFVGAHADYLSAHGLPDRARSVLEGFLERAPDQCFVLGALAELDAREGELARAWARLEEAFRLEPNYPYGWELAFRWLEETDDPVEAERVLDRMGPEARRNPDLASRRLRVLRAAGVPRDALEPEWAALLAEQPAALPVLGRRFDAALADDDPEAAEAALAGLTRFHPDDPATLARQARWAAPRGDPETAIEAAVRLVSAPGDVHPASLLEVARALDGPGLRVKVARTLRARLAEGAPLPSGGLISWLAAMDELQDPGPIEILAFGLQEAPPLGHPEHAFAMAASKLCADEGGAATVLRFVAAEPDRFARDDQLRQVQAQARAVRGDPGGARDVLSGWRNLAGIEQWGLAIYAWSCLELGDEDEALAAIEHGLFRLPYTGAGASLARRGCLIALRRRDPERFLVFLDRLRFVAGPPADEEHAAFELFGDLYEETVPPVRLEARFRSLALPPDGELSALWKEAIHPRLPWWRKMAALVGL